MLLGELIRKNPEDVFNYLERNVNYRFPFRRGYSEVPKRYRPDGNLEYFYMPFVQLDLNNVSYFDANPDKKLKEEVITEDKVKFFVHPHMIHEYERQNLDALIKFQGKYKVSPLASTRSVLTRGLDYNFVIKTNLPRKTGGFVRKMKHDAMEHSNKLIRELDNTSLPSRLGYLPESMALCYKNNGFEIGTIFRELKARPYTQEKTFLIPFFSLLSLDSNKKEDPLLLCQIIENSKKNDEDEFESFNKSILTPIIDTFSYLVLEKGIVPEPHSQNLFLELNKDGKPERIVYSDFQDYGIDLSIREKKGLNCNFSRNPIDKCFLKLDSEEGLIEKEGFRRIKYSCVYDFVIGRILDNCSIALSNYPSCEPKKIAETTKKLFSERFGDVEEELFPKEDCFYHTVTQNGEEKTFNIRKLGKKRYR